MLVGMFGQLAGYEENFHNSDLKYYSNTLVI